MYRKLFLSMIFLFVFASAFFGLAATSAIDEPSPSPDAFDLSATSIIRTATANAMPVNSPDAFEMTATSIIATATAQARPSQTIDPFALTATSIIATATANAIISPTPPSPVPCEGFEWQEVWIDYNRLDGGNWRENPRIRQISQCYSRDEDRTLYSHIILVSGDYVLPDENLYVILDDAISRLLEYPPLEPQVSEMILVVNAEPIPFVYLGQFSHSEAIEAYETGLRGADLAELLEPIDETQAQPSQTIDPFALTATSIIATATAQARPSQTIDPFALTATSIIATATANAHPSGTIDPFALTATSIIATASASAESSQQFLPFPYTATALSLTEAAIAIASPTHCQGFDWTFTYFAAEASYGIDAHELTRRYCTNSDFTLYSFEISIMDASGSLSDEDFYMLFESVIGSLAEFPEEYPIRKPDISEQILLTNFNTMETWEFTYTEAVDAWDEDLRGAELAEALGVTEP